MNLKFRIWDSEQKKYLDKYTVYHLENDCGVCSIVLNMDIKKIDGEDRFKIETFIGIRDDNGKEIYEGDIIKHGCNAQHYESVVIYKAPSFLAANFYYKQNTFNIFDESPWDVVWTKKGIEAFHQGYYRNDMMFSPGDRIEVIGNINENPELLDNREK